MSFLDLIYSKKGQVSAPFELLVAVIIMSFVVIIGSQMLSAANREVCVNNIDKELSEFKTMLEKTSSFKTSTKFNFENPDNCFNEKNAEIRIEKVIKNPKLCSAICLSADNTCHIMNFIISKSGITKQKCLNLSQFTVFRSDGCDETGQELQGYYAVDPSKNLPIGNYILRNIAKSGDTYPVICTYYSRSGK